MALLGSADVQTIDVAGPQIVTAADSHTLASCLAGRLDVNAVRGSSYLALEQRFEVGFSKR